MIKKDDDYITRVINGYQVRFAQGKKESLSKFFADSKYKNPKRAAKIWRNKILKEIELPAGRDKIYWGKGYYREENLRKGKPYPRWVGSYYINKKRKTARFSVDVYGEVGAMRSAKKFREEGIAEKLS